LWGLSGDRSIRSPVTQRLRRVIAILALGCGPQSCAFLCNTEQFAGPPDGGSSDAGGGDAGAVDGGSASCDAGALAPVFPTSACVIDGTLNHYDVQLTWQSGGTDVVGYRILRRQTCASDPAFYPVGFVDGGTTTLAIDLVQCWRYDYSYRIVPVSACGSSGETSDDPYELRCQDAGAAIDAGDVVKVFTLEFCDGGPTPTDGSHPSCCSGPDSGC
jgi:hypothetical protein